MTVPSPPVPLTVSIPTGLIKAVWAVVAALGVAAVAIFWAGYNWAEFGSRLKKIDEFDKKFAELQNVQRLSKDDEKSGSLGSGTPPVACPKGYVVVAVQIGSQGFVIHCGQLVR